jgi:hypothetical protein
MAYYTKCEHAYKIHILNVTVHVRKIDAIDSDIVDKLMASLDAVRILLKVNCNHKSSLVARLIFP